MINASDKGIFVEFWRKTPHPWFICFQIAKKYENSVKTNPL